MSCMWKNNASVKDRKYLICTKGYIYCKELPLNQSITEAEELRQIETILMSTISYIAYGQIC